MRTTWQQSKEFHKPARIAAKFFLITSNFHFFYHEKKDMLIISYLTHQIQLNSFERSLHGSSRLEVFCKKGALKNCAKFTEKQQCQTLLKKKLWHRCFPVNFVKFLRTAFSIEHLRRLRLLTEVTTAWNHHIISHQRYDGPLGEPDIIFFLPHTYHEQ